MARHSWTRDELILALDLYFTEPAARGNKSHPGVLKLSHLLNILPLHPQAERDDFFRNPNGVAMKLSNFLRFDPDYKGKGLTAGNRLEAEVWEEFSKDRPRLRRVAAVIRAAADFRDELEVDESDEEFEAREGRILASLHRTRERSLRIAKRKKDRILKATGALRCEICDFDFREAYGELGEGFAECHHIVPLSDLKPGSRVRLEDLAILCANCHRMIHRRGGLTMDAVRAALQECSVA